MKKPHWKPDPDELEMVHCPLCHGGDFVGLATTDRYDMDLKTAGCTGCGFVTTNPQPTEKALDVFYREHYRFFYQKTDTPSLQYIQEYKKDQRADQTAAYLLAQGLLADNSAILDLGCGEGSILKAIAEKNPSTTRIGIEPTKSFGEFARDYASCEYFQSLEDQRKTDRKVDLVIINHVLEHVKNPVKFLDDLRSLLTPTGRIYIDVPDIERYDGVGALHIGHIHHFGIETLTLTATRANYAIHALEKHDPVMHPPSIRCILAPSNNVPQVKSIPHRQGWSAVLQCERSAWRFHRKKWSLGHRIAHLIRTRSITA